MAQTEENAKAMLEVLMREYKTMYQAVAAVAKMNDRIQAA